MVLSTKGETTHEYHIKKVNANLDSDLLDEFIKEFKRMYTMVKKK